MPGMVKSATLKVISIIIWESWCSCVRAER